MKNNCGAVAEDGGKLGRKLSALELVQLQLVQELASQDLGGQCRISADLGEGLQQFMCALHDSREGHCHSGSQDRLPAVHPEDPAVIVAGVGDGGCYFQSRFQSVQVDGAGG